VEITVEAVKAAYAKTGLKPIKEEFYSQERNCACGISALAIATNYDVFMAEMKNPKSPGPVTTISEILGLTRNEVWAFTTGFDGCTLMVINKEYTQRERELYEVGFEAGKQLLGEAKL
jgi:hypothetical protein